jgi:hypothetical protein
VVQRISGDGVIPTGPAENRHLTPKESPMRTPIIRRLTALAGSGVLLLSVAGSAAAHELWHVRDTWFVPQIVWGHDPAEGGRGGSAALFTDGDQAFFEYRTHDTRAVVCDAGTPGDPADDYEGVVGSEVGGSASEVAVVLDERRLRWASAAGTMTIVTYAVDTCAGTWDVVDETPAVPFALDLVAAGPVERWTDVYRVVVPGELVELSINRATVRPAVGTLTLGGETRESGADSGSAIILRGSATGHFVVH